MKLIEPERDAIVAAMEKYNVPMTREKYLYRAYGGNPPDPNEPLDAEVESMLPWQFQRAALDDVEGGVQ